MNTQFDGLKISRNFLLVLLLTVLAFTAKAEELTLHYHQLSLTELTDVLQENIGSNVDIPTLTEGLPSNLLSLTNVSIDMTVDAIPSFTVRGTTSILGQLQTDILITMVNSSADYPDILFGLRVNTIELSDLIPALSAGAMSFPASTFTFVPSLYGRTESMELTADDLSSSAALFYQQAYGAADYTLNVEPGVNLITEWSLENLPALVFSRMGIQPGTVVKLEGSLDLSLDELASGNMLSSASMYLKADIPIDFQTPSGFPQWMQTIQPQGMSVEVAYSDSQLLTRVGMKFDTNLDGQAQPFIGSTIVALGSDSNEITFAGAMLDTWKQPFGVPWLNLEDVGVIASLNADGSAHGELFGAFALGNTFVSTDIVFDGGSNGTSVQFNGYVDRLQPAELIQLVEQHTGLPSLTDKLPASISELRDVQLSFTVGASPSFSVQASTLMNITLDGQARNILGTIDIQVDGGGGVVVNLSGEVAGGWSQPFGISWLNLNEASLDFSVNGQQIGGAIHSYFMLGSKRIEVGLSFTGGARATSARLTGSVSQLSMNEFAQLVTKQLPVSPFADTNLELVFNNVSLTLDVGSKTGMSIAASVILNGQQADLLFSAATINGKAQIITGFQLKYWALSDTLPVLQGTAIEMLRFNTVALILSKAEGRILSSDLSPEAYAFYQKIYGTDDFILKMQPGVQLVGAVPLANNPLNTPMNAIGVDTQQLLVAGSLPGSILGLGGPAGLAGLALRAELPPLAPPGSPDWFVQGQLALEVTGQPSIGFVGEMTVKVTKDILDINSTESDVLTFAMESKIQREGPSVAVAMVGALRTAGDWQAPFGVDWLTIKDTVFKLSVNVYGDIGLGFAGGMVVGEKDIEMAMGLAINAYTGVPTNFIIDATSESGLQMQDLVKLQHAMAKTVDPLAIELPIVQLPDMSIKSMHLKFAPRNDPDLDVTAGLAISGDLWLPISPTGEAESFAAINMDIGFEGIIAQGYLGAFAIGPVKWQDAMLDFELSLLNQHFFISGALDSPFVGGHLDLAITREGLHLDSLINIAEFNAGLTADASFDLMLPTFTAKLVMPEVFKQNLGQMLVQNIRNKATADVAFAKQLLGNTVSGWNEFQQNPQANLHRLMDFYASVGLPTPDWLIKINATMTQIINATSAVSLPPPENLLDLAIGGFTLPATAGVAGNITQLCNLGTGFWQSGQCWTILPTPQVNRTVCGIRNWKWTCWSVVLVPAYQGLPGTITEICNLGTGIWQDGKCWTIPPIKLVEIPGVCEVTPIPCNVQSLITDTVIPVMTQHIEKLTSQPPVIVVDSHFDNSLDEIFSGGGLMMKADLLILGTPQHIELGWSFQNMTQNILTMGEKVIAKMW